MTQPGCLTLDKLTIWAHTWRAACSFNDAVNLTKLLCFTSSMLICEGAIAYGHSSGLPPQEALIMIAEKHRLFFSILMLFCLAELVAPADWIQLVHWWREAKPGWKPRIPVGPLLWVLLPAVETKP